MRVIKNCDDWNNQLMSFLQNVSGININNDILLNASIIVSNDVDGVLSFEEFGNIGLIRYFVFKKHINALLLYELLNSVVETAITKNINKLICFIDNDEVLTIFEFLGFKKIIKSNVYIEEAKMEDANIVVYELDLSKYL